MMRKENNRSRDFSSNRPSGFNSKFGGSSKPFNNQDRQMHKAKCSECSSDCEVPFKPTEGKPVYCRTCFAKNRPDNRF